MNYINLFLLPIIFCTLTVFGQSPEDKTKGKIILTILAHPDDETAIGPFLAKYAKDHTMYLVLAADGRYGVRDHAGIPLGDSLVKVRELETICSCEALGIQPPVFLGFHDGLGALSGLGEYLKQTAQLKEKIKEIIEEINPDAIITFGPDGDTGHPDHRALNNFTTEVVLREGWYEKYPLYFVGWPKDKEGGLPMGITLNYVDEKYLNVRLKYGDAEREKYFESIRCHKSQFTEEEMNDQISAELIDNSFTSYFRKFTVDTNIVNDLFD